MSYYTEMKLTGWRPIAAIVLLLTTAAIFIAYITAHPEIIDQLRQTSLLTLGTVLALYIVGVACLALINTVTLWLCNVRLGNQESLLLTMYSSVINFFGPLQSGPAVRAVYVKKKHGVNLKKYTAATLLYYLFFAAISGAFLLSGIFHWWLMLAVIAGFAVLFVALRSTHPKLQRFQQLNLHVWYMLAAATLLQICIVTAIYYVELRSVVPDVGLGQVIIYTGAANFALFVSLTPGAIGFRESFLLFSQRLHHIDSQAIVVANTIDRAVYIVLLIILAVCIFGTHVNQRFAAKTTST